MFRKIDYQYYKKLYTNKFTQLIMFSIKEIQKLVKQKEHENKQRKLIKDRIPEYSDTIATQISLNMNTCSIILPYTDKVYSDILSTELRKIGISNDITKNNDSKLVINLYNLQRVNVSGRRKRYKQYRNRKTKS